MENKKLPGRSLAFCGVSTLLALFAAQNLWMILPDAAPGTDLWGLMNYFMLTVQAQFAENFLAWCALALCFAYAFRRLYFGK